MEISFPPGIMSPLISFSIWKCQEIYCPRTLFKEILYLFRVWNSKHLFTIISSEWRKVKLAALEFFTVSHRLPPSSKWAAALMLSADSIKGKKELRSTMNYVCTSKSQWWRCQQPRKYKIVTGTSKAIIYREVAWGSGRFLWNISEIWAGFEQVGNAEKNIVKN